MHQVTMLSVMSRSGSDRASAFHLAAIVSSKICEDVEIADEISYGSLPHLGIPIRFISELIHESHHGELA
jgi:hypothetical protein